jgi:uncharacterized YccA/Bax inhibitor family protein
MALFKSSNPALKSSAFESLAGTAHDSDVMTVQGAMNKSATLLLLLVAAAGLSWYALLANPALALPLVIGGVVGGLVVAIILTFKKEWSPVLAPVYAILEGLALGAISLAYEAAFSGLVLTAIVLTIAVFAVMLFLYATRVIQVTQQFRVIIVAATAGIAVFYLLAFVLRFFGIEMPLIHSTGTFGIIFSLVVVGIAAMNLALDFDFIEQGAQQGVPKYMEWYSAFGLLVTLVWLYLEILRLLSKLRSR